MTVAENVEALPQPRSGNYEVARYNALRHGVLSQYTVLPWEDGAEYNALIEALAAEHSPQGPTEEHLVEELAGIIWRKRRLRLAESAAHHRALKRTTDPYRETAQPRLFTRPPVTQAKMKAGPWMTRSAPPKSRRQKNARTSIATKP